MFRHLKHLPRLESKGSLRRFDDLQRCVWIESAISYSLSVVFNHAVLLGSVHPRCSLIQACSAQARFDEAAAFKMLTARPTFVRATSRELNGRASKKPLYVISKGIDMRTTLAPASAGGPDGAGVGNRTPAKSSSVCTLGTGSVAFRRNCTSITLSRMF